MTRPADLPDYKAPPLIEVLVGIQFAHSLTFPAVDVGRVWDLFQSEFPNNQDLMPVPPRFETFGGASFQQAFTPSFHVPMPGWAGRVRFLSEDQRHMLQFQPGQFVANWLRGGDDQPYPHFEEIIKKFETNAKVLSSFYKDKFDAPLLINQAEVTYANIIKVDSLSEIGNFFNGWGGECDDIEMVNINAATVVKDVNLQPYARLHQELQAVITRDGQQKAFRLNLTFRGKPSGTSIDDTKAFLLDGRKAIVNKFTDMTTETAHKLWERQA